MTTSFRDRFAAKFGSNEFAGSGPTRQTKEPSAADKKLLATFIAGLLDKGSRKKKQKSPRFGRMLAAARSEGKEEVYLESLIRFGKKRLTSRIVVWNSATSNPTLWGAKATRMGAKKGQQSIEVGTWEDYTDTVMFILDLPTKTELQAVRRQKAIESLNGLQLAYFQAVLAADEAEKLTAAGLSKGAAILAGTGKSAEDTAAEGGE